MSVLKRVPQPKAKSNWLIRHASDVTSQCGEDGIIEKIFEEILPKDEEASRWCVEFGAWDGQYLSNTYNLLHNKGWSGVLLEADPLRFNELQRRYLSNPNVFCINELVTFEGERCLDSLLLNTPCPKTFDLISIDVDGNDYHIWDGLRHFEPKAVIIEFNPSIPSTVIYIQERDMSVYQGSSILALVELGRQKGYELVAVTTFNAIFVKKEYFPLFNIADNSLQLMRDFPMESLFFQLYDGTLVLTGCRKLLWHKMAISHKDLQVLPASKRKFPFAPPQNTPVALYRARLVYLACLQRYMASASSTSQGDNDGPQQGDNNSSADDRNGSLGGNIRADSPPASEVGSSEADVAELIQLGAGLLRVPAQEEVGAQDGHEILGYALLLASHDKDLMVTGPRRVAALYEKRGDQEHKNHGVQDGLRWYKRALYSLCPSGDENIPAMVALLCKIGAAYIALRSWSKALFWLHLATTLAPDDVHVWKQLARLHRKRGDKLALGGARQRVTELEATARDTTLQQHVRTMSPTAGIKNLLSAGSDVLSINDSEDNESERGGQQHRRVFSLGALTSAVSEEGNIDTNSSLDDSRADVEDWDGDIGVDRTSMVSSHPIDFTVNDLSGYREREQVIRDLKLILSAREEELKDSQTRSSRLFSALVGTTCCTALAAITALVLLVGKGPPLSRTLSGAGNRGR